MSHLLESRLDPERRAQCQAADDSDIRWQRELTRHRAPHWMFAPRTAVQERIQHPAHSANASANRQQIRRPRLGSRA